MTKLAAQTVAEAFLECRDMDASLNERLQSFYEATQRLATPLADAVERLISRLRTSDAGAASPQVGEPMPEFVLPDDAGRIVTLDKLRARGPVAVTFNRGHWCPYCRISVKALVNAHARIEAAGGQIVAIMPDRQQFASQFRVEADAPFPILTDLDGGYALLLNLVIWVGAEMEQAMRRIGQDLPKFQGNESWMLPIPATFVVGRDGLIKARFVDPDYRKRMAIDELLQALREAR